MTPVTSPTNGRTCDVGSRCRATTHNVALAIEEAFFVLVHVWCRKWRFQLLLVVARWLSDTLFEWFEAELICFGGFFGNSSVEMGADLLFFATPSFQVWR